MPDENNDKATAAEETGGLAGSPVMMLQRFQIPEYALPLRQAQKSVFPGSDPLLSGCPYQGRRYTAYTYGAIFLQLM